MAELPHVPETTYGPRQPPPVSTVPGPYSDRTAQGEALLRHRRVHHERQSTVDGEQKHPPSRSFTLSEADTKLLSDTYADFLGLLRSNSFATSWIVPWTQTPYPNHSEAKHLNLSLSRGYRTAHICCSGGCLPAPSTLLQKTSTLLLPVQSRDSVVVGYFLDLAVESHAHRVSPVLRTGKYVYCPTSRELLKVSKVRGPASASGLFSVCITRVALVGSGMFVTDHVLTSFPWQEPSRVPSRCVAHSRSLTFHKLLQTAQQAGLEEHFMDASDTEAQTGDHDFGIAEHSFYGLAAFGLYECALVPAKLGVGAHPDPPADRPSLAFGNWALPEHAAFCNMHQVLHLGLSRQETVALRAQFVQAYGHVSAQVPPPVMMPGQISRQGLAQRISTADINQMSAPTLAPQLSPLGLPSQHVPKQQRLTEPLEFSSGPSEHHGSSEALQQAFGSKHTRGSRVEGHEASTRARSDAAGGVVAAMVRLGGRTGDDDTAGSDVQGASIMLPIQRQMTGVNIAERFHHAASGETESGMRNTLSSAGAVPRMLQTVLPGALEEDRRQEACGLGSVSVRILPPMVPQPQAEPDHACKANSKTAVDSVEPLGTRMFKKTLPAPTKSEIVIRNRISAQRSNEKRRRKIEATKSELAYLKTTYLPQLEMKRGALVSENQTLRLKFMERYQESDIDSFF